MITTASQYHQYTSYERNRMGGHYLDWQNQPVVRKDYPGIEPVPLPGKEILPEGSIFSILKDSGPGKTARLLDIGDLSQILRLTHTLTAKANYSGQDFYYRSAASAGALYPPEIYTAIRGIEGLDDGLYYYSLDNHALFPLRIENLSEYIAYITIPPPQNVPIMAFFFTAIFFRSAWKYQDRAYRYHLLDTGHVIENLVIAMKALRLPLNLSYDFDDMRVNHLLGLDEMKEVSLAIAHLPGSESISSPGDREIDTLSRDIRNASVVSGREMDYKSIREVHQAGGKAVSIEYSESEIMSSLGLPPATWQEISETPPRPGHIGYPECLFRRRSSRNFIRQPLDRESLFALLDTLCEDGIDDQAGESRYAKSLSVGFLADNIEGVPPGLYLLDTMGRRIGLIKEGSFIDWMAGVCLDQAWLAHSAIHFLFLSNLALLDRIWGPRGYRYAMMTAGRMGERIYVAATSMGLGCCGIGALYDNEASELIGLNRDSHLLYLVAVGKIKSLLKRK